MKVSVRNARPTGPIGGDGSTSLCAPSSSPEPEEEWRKRTGGPMTAHELERVLQRYPGTASG
jgi:hypothetical protein